MMKVLNTLAVIVCMLLSIAFFTLMERKFISFSQNRKGPNKTAILGIVQPISDAIKLLGKELNMNQKSNFMSFMMAPCANLALSLNMWMIIPFVFKYNFMKMSTLFVISCMALNMITLMMMSWASNSNYAFIGMMRTISQLISYEINLILIIIIIISLTNQMSLSLMWMTQTSWPILMFLPIIIMWMITILAETNRTPFDFSEGESELVSGFNVEYSSSSFVFLFLSEYSSILLLSMMTTMMFTSSTPDSPSFYIFYMSVCFFFIWARVTFPRFRYDKLMKLNWTQILPASTYILMWALVFKMYCAMKD